MKERVRERKGGIVDKERESKNEKETRERESDRVGKESVEEREGVTENDRECKRVK